MLYIVSTPIGNLKDITLRALEVLKTVELIAAEDTRHTKVLLDHYDIKTPLTSYFEHNKVKKGDYLLGLLKEGKNIALVTDAGTPGISDPGYNLINLAKAHQIQLTVVPGATALIAALSISGFPSDSFIFQGFLPVKSAARRRELEKIKGEKRTVIFYESPYRIEKALEDIKDVLDDPYIAVARELTKKFEEITEGKASEVIAKMGKGKPKGEFVVLVNLKKANSG